MPKCLLVNLNTIYFDFETCYIKDKNGYKK
jgi:hypothetical protein